MSKSVFMIPDRIEILTLFRLWCIQHAQYANPRKEIEESKVAL